MTQLDVDRDRNTTSPNPLDVDRDIAAKVSMFKCTRRSELAVAPPPKIRCPQISTVLEEVRPYDLPLEKILGPRRLPGGE